jgi:hypothetical protein
MRLKGLVKWLTNMPAYTAAAGRQLIPTYELALAQGSQARRREIMEGLSTS